jgi:hypothetical protein
MISILNVYSAVNSSGTEVIAENIEDKKVMENSKKFASNLQQVA